MNYCKEIRLHMNNDKCWLEYEMKTTTRKIPVGDLDQAVSMMITLRNNVDEWVESD